MAKLPAPSGERAQDPARRPVPGGPGWETEHDGQTQLPDPAVRGFAVDGPLDQARPGIDLTRALDDACGPDRSCPGASDDELCGMLGRWEATEAWAAAAKLAVIRELIRRRALPGYEPERPGALPGAWQEGLTQEVSCQLGISLRAADALIDLAWALQARLPLTGAALGAGVISLVKARIIHEATAALGG